MYTIYHNGSLMYSPEFDEYTLEAPIMTLEANKFGTLQFTIYPDHPNYSNISKITSVLSVYKDGALYRQLRPTYSKRAFRNGITHKCESVLARLNDFQFRPFIQTQNVLLEPVVFLVIRVLDRMEIVLKELFRTFQILDIDSDIINSHSMNLLNLSGDRGCRSEQDHQQRDSQKRA